MRQQSVVKACDALYNLTNCRLPVKKAYSVYKLQQALESPYNFVANEERKAIEDCHAEVQPDGKITFKEISDAVKYRDRMNEVYDMDVEIKAEPVTLTEKDMGDATISPADIAALEGLITFDLKGE